MMAFLWILGGCIIVSVAYVLPGHSPDLWPNINSAGIALLVYLASLLGLYGSRVELTRRRRFMISGAVVFFIAVAIFSWRQMQDQSEWQRHELSVIGGTIARGIYLSEVPDSLLTVLHQYHQQTGKHRRSLGQLYAAQYPPGTPGDAWSSMAQMGRPDPPNDIFLTSISDSQVVIVARHPWYKGRQASFVNEHGTTGTVQIRYTLTTKGIEYVTEN